MRLFSKFRTLALRRRLRQGALGGAGLAPSFSELPVLSGLAKEGQEASVSEGVYTGDGPITVSRQFKLDGQPIGLDQATYLFEYDDVGASSLTCDVTLTNAIDSVTITTNAIGPVIQAPELLFDEYFEYTDAGTQGYSDTDPVGSLAGRVLGTLATSTGSARPTYAQDVGGVPGALEFDGTDDRLDLDAIASWFNPGETYTIAYAYRGMAPSSSAFRYIWSAGNASANTWLSSYARFANHYPYMRRDGTVVGTLAPVDTNDDWTVTIVEEGPTGAGSRTASIDFHVSPDDGLATATTSDPFTDETPMTTLTWGARRTGGGGTLGFYFEGDLRGLGIKRSRMTLTEIARWERYCDDQGWT